MSLHYEDVSSSVFKALLDAQAVSQPLNGSNVLYPGEDYNTTDLDSWAIPYVGEMVNDHSRGKGGSGTFVALIWSRIGVPTAFALRDILANNFRQAVEGKTFSIMNYITGDGLSKVGYIKFREGQFLTSGVHGEGVYTSTFTCPFRLEET